MPRPRSHPIPSLPGVLENSGPQAVNLFGISDGIGDVNQTVKITATSSNPNLIPNPSVTYTNPNTTGTLTFTPVAYGIGTATITVTLMDNGGTANGGHDTTITTFNVTVNAVNQPPTLTAIPNQGPILENTSGAQSRQPHGHHRPASVISGQSLESISRHQQQHGPDPQPDRSTSPTPMLARAPSPTACSPTPAARRRSPSP